MEIFCVNLTQLPQGSSKNIEELTLEDLPPVAKYVSASADLAVVYSRRLLPGAAAITNLFKVVKGPPEVKGRYLEGVNLDALTSLLPCEPNEAVDVTMMTHPDGPFMAASEANQTMATMGTLRALWGGSEKAPQIVALTARYLPAEPLEVPPVTVFKTLVVQEELLPDSVPRPPFKKFAINQLRPEWVESFQAIFYVEKRRAKLLLHPDTHSVGREFKRDHILQLTKAWARRFKYTNCRCLALMPDGSVDRVWM